ncbi:hypothetical protein YC2023_059268 [Brassica napus]
MIFCDWYVEALPKSVRPSHSILRQEVRRIIQQLEKVLLELSSVQTSIRVSFVQSSPVHSRRQGWVLAKSFPINQLFIGIEDCELVLFEFNLELWLNRCFLDLVPSGFKEIPYSLDREDSEERGHGLWLSLFRKCILITTHYNIGKRFDNCWTTTARPSINNKTNENPNLRTKPR